MAKLDDITRDPFFTTPPDYFERLPERVQSRLIETRRATPMAKPLSYALRFAMAAIVLTAGWFYYRAVAPPAAETILAAVDTPALVDYLQEAGLTTEEILEGIELTEEEVELFENEIYQISFPDIEINELN